MHDQEIEKFGLFFGAHLDYTTLDRLKFTKVNHVEKARLQAQERALYGNKWFDYRFMHETLATFLFARAYGQVAKTIYGRHIDVRRVQWFQALKNEDVFRLAVPVQTGLWRARQFADALGMPYELYIEIAMERLMRYKRPFLPRPQQLYSDDAVQAARDGWHEYQGAKLYVATDVRYRNRYYRGWVHQDDHRKWVIDQLARRPDPASMIATYLWKYPVITPELVVNRWGSDMLARAHSFCS